jgi:hypothetical protein
VGKVDPFGLASPQEQSTSSPIWQAISDVANIVSGYLSAAVTHLPELPLGWTSHLAEGPGVITDTGFGLLHGGEALLHFLEIEKKRQEQRRELCEAFPTVCPDRNKCE